MKKTLVLMCMIGILLGITACSSKAPIIEMESETIMVEVHTQQFSLNDLSMYINAYTYKKEKIPFADLKLTGEYDLNTLGNYPLSVTAADGKNSSTKTIYLSVVDTTPPQLSCYSKEILLYRDTTFDADPTMNLIFAYDSYDGLINERISYEGEVDASKTGTYPVTYHVTDSSGNTNSLLVNYRVTDSMEEFVQFLYQRTIDFYWGKYFISDQNGKVVNYDDAIYYQFTNAGTAQFERSSGLAKNTDGVESGILLVQKEDGVYLSIETSIVVNNYLSTQFVKAYERSPLLSYHALVSYNTGNNSTLQLEYEFTIKKVQGKWYVEHFILPNS